MNVDEILEEKRRSCLFMSSLCRFENELVIAVGKGEPAAVMSEYGFK